jgi:hypothetical protein
MRKGLLLILLLVAMTARSQSKEIPSSYCISEEENRLYMMINEYRGRFDLPPVPLSKSLCYVASLHVKDLVTNHPDENGCNAHSWSNRGKWKAFCYPKDENKQNSVWNKPMELTQYKGKAYEIIYWETDETPIDSIMMMWKSVDYFNNFLTNTGKWTGRKWNAIGIAVYGNYASAWFGELPDPAGLPRVCGAPEPEPVVPQPVQDTTKKPPVKEKPSAKTKPLPKQKTKPVVNDSVPVSPPVAPVPVVNKPEVGKYYIITLSNQPESVMQKALNTAVTKGYPDAKILNGDKKRLSVAEFRQKAAADSALRVIRKSYKDAWILVK